MRSAETSHGNGARAPKRAGLGGSKRGATGNVLVSPIQGTVIRLEAAEGQEVAAGDLICVVEAMKMENEVIAHKSGRISALHVSKGAMVQIGAAIVDIE